ncbi:hypothetical protein TFLX_06615 [Thermoflexales bacterium]|nr:hypothetical protein TFLX_06615 [Thermoflexales bacterium]
MDEPPLTRTLVAVLGTLTEFHHEPLPYNLKALVKLVTDLRPDLLCLDITATQWQQRDFADLPPEYREALLPLAQQTDIVVVPIGAARPLKEPQAAGWRGRAIALLRRGLIGLQRTSPDPAAINQGWRHHVANELYDTIARLAGQSTRHAWHAHTVHLTQRVRETAQRDPGCRILVVVNVRYCHHLRPVLRQYPEIDVVSYSHL